MQIAEILSDLTSLRVCDHDAALTLVTSYKNLEKSSANAAVNSQTKPESVDAPPHNVDSVQLKASVALQGEDPDLQRAIDLVDLHYGLKEKYMQGVDTGLQQARENVNRVLQRLSAENNGASPKR